MIDVLFNSEWGYALFFVISVSAMVVIDYFLGEEAEFLNAYAIFANLFESLFGSSS